MMQYRYVWQGSSVMMRLRPVQWAGSGGSRKRQAEGRYLDGPVYLRVVDECKWQRVVVIVRLLLGEMVTQSLY